MADPDWIGRQPLSSYWGDNSESVFYSQKEKGTPLTHLWQVDSQNASEAQQVALSKLHAVSYSDSVTNPQGTYSAWVFEGNIFVKALSGAGPNALRQITQDGGEPKQLKFLNDGRLTYRRGNRIFSVDLNSGFSQKLVSWEFSDAPEANAKPADYVAEQQIELIDYVAKKRNDRQLKRSEEHTSELQSPD